MVKAEREPEQVEGEDAWSDADSEAEIAGLMQFDLSDEAPGTGKSEYLAECESRKIVPVAMFIAKLECSQINLRHHGMGVNGAYAVAAALQVNTHIRSLNLGDNWLGDEGAMAIAAVLGHNKTLTSLNLAENRIGVYGARALCDGLLKTTTLKEIVLRGNGCVPPATS
jgi:Ran GTPase-activating protein (RanGAP) involved in mRNA processing and transport